MNQQHVGSTIWTWSWPTNYLRFSARPSRRNSLVKSKWQSGLRFNPLLNVWTALSIRSRWCPPWRRRWPMWRPPSNSSVVGSMTSTAPAFQSWRHTWNKWRRLWHCRLWTLTSIAGNGHSPSRASRGLPTRTTLTPGLHASSWPRTSRHRRCDRIRLCRMPSPIAQGWFWCHHALPGPRHEEPLAV